MVKHFYDQLHIHAQYSIEITNFSTKSKNLFKIISQKSTQLTLCYTRCYVHCNIDNASNKTNTEIDNCNPSVYSRFVILFVGSGTFAFKHGSQTTKSPSLNPECEIMRREKMY